VILDQLADRHLGALRSELAALDRAGLKRVAAALRDAQLAGRRVFVLGNGGSAMNASHLACDLGSGVAGPGVPRCRALGLTDSAAVVTARANDASFAHVFVDQLETHYEPRSVVLALSASGDSENVLAAVDWARARDGVTVALVGSGGGKLASRVDHALVSASACPGVVESLHAAVGHLLCDFLRRPPTDP
jgi:D-sedoheptulose 7-phosphate isomerase